MLFDQSRSCFWCGKPSTVEMIDRHHTERRSTSPERKNDPSVLVDLCRTCHERTERSNTFFLKIQHLWNLQSKGSSIT
jgi:hypothetical protein